MAGRTGGDEKRSKRTTSTQPGQFVASPGRDRAGQERAVIPASRGPGVPLHPDNHGDPLGEIRSRIHLRELVDDLPDGAVGAATRYLDLLRSDPVFLAEETAPEDDEELTTEQRERLAERVADRIRGTVAPVSLEDARRELGW
jgi:hypothetical protein